MSDLVNAWYELRSELHELERLEHPDITDRLGRVWAWKSGDLYRHCSTAAPKFMIEHFGLPKQEALDNPNYDLCGICLDGRERNVNACKPEWSCTHTWCGRQ